MKCSRRHEVRGLLRQGHWPEASPVELRAHVEGCKGCAELVMLEDGFRAAREQTARQAKLASPSLIFWRAQLRRRRQAMEQVGKPIRTAQIFALVISLCGGAGVVGWVLVSGYWRNWTGAAAVMGSSVKSLVGGWGLLPVVAGGVLLGLVAVFAVVGTVERE